jgi:hypothetical protein
MQHSVLWKKIPPGYLLNISCMIESRRIVNPQESGSEWKMRGVKMGVSREQQTGTCNI